MSILRLFSRKVNDDKITISERNLVVAPTDYWQNVVDKAMNDLLWAMSEAKPDDPMVAALQYLHDSLKNSDAKKRWQAMRDKQRSR